MRIIKGLPGQTIFDIAIQEYGDIEGLGFLMEDNGVEILSADLQTTDIKIRETVINQTVKDFFEGKTIVTE